MDDKQKEGNNMVNSNNDVEAVGVVTENPVVAAATDSVLLPETTTTTSDAVVIGSTPRARAFREWRFALFILVVAAAATGLIWYGLEQRETVAIDGVQYPKVVAIVNGEKVSAADFAQSYKQAAAIAAQQGFDPATNEEARTEVKDQALRVLVNTVLLKQLATAAGYNVNEEDIDAKVAELETQFGGQEQLASAIAAAGLDISAMRSDVHDQLLIDKYLTASPEWAEITVSDEEVKAYYDLAVPQLDKPPAFDEVKEQIREQLKTEKEAKASTALIERIRSEADIVEKI